MRVHEEEEGEVPHVMIVWSLMMKREQELSQSLVAWEGKREEEIPWSGVCLRVQWLLVVSAGLEWVWSPVCPLGAAQACWTPALLEEEVRVVAHPLVNCSAEEEHQLGQTP